jgi:phosphoglycolate phosphatase
MSVQAVVFDLDGTLLDTLDDIADAANHALASEGFPTHPPEAYRHFIGDGVFMLMRRALPPDRGDDDAIARCVALYRAAYAQGWNRKTRPYDGIPEVVDALSQRKIALAVLSNKPDEFTQLCISEYFAHRPFAIVLGHRDDLPRKPDPTSALTITRRLGLAAERCWFVGDTLTDMETARRAAMRPIGVAWGFRTRDELRSAGAEIVLERPGDLLELVDCWAGGPIDPERGA